MKKYSLFLSLAASVSILSCNNNTGGNTDAPPAGDTATSSVENSTPAPFTKEVSYRDYKFTVATKSGVDEHHFTISSQGLTEVNDTFTVDVKGAIKDVIIDDIDGDNSPEIAVIDLMGPNQMGHVHMFSAFSGKSMGMVNFPELPEGDKVLNGYKGFDEYNFVEGTFIRRFPIYDGENKTGKLRQLQYKLKPGEAMKQLVLDKTDEY
jgi:hypothetical protein